MVFISKIWFMVPRNWDSVKGSPDFFTQNCSRISNICGSHGGIRNKERSAGASTVIAINEGIQQVILRHSEGI